MSCTKIFYDNDYCLKIRNDTTALNAAILNGEVFAYCLPTWGLNYNIMPNFPDQAGDWAVCEGRTRLWAGVPGSAFLPSRIMLKKPTFSSSMS